MSEPQQVDSSFDRDDVSCFTNGISDYPEDDGRPIPIRKLQDTFDSIAKPEDNNFKVYLRVRPVSDVVEVTAKVVSDTVIDG